MSRSGKFTHFYIAYVSHICGKNEILKMKKVIFHIYMSPLVEYDVSVCPKLQEMYLWYRFTFLWKIYHMYRSLATFCNLYIFFVCKNTHISTFTYKKMQMLYEKWLMVDPRNIFFRERWNNTISTFPEILGMQKHHIPPTGSYICEKPLFSFW